MNLFGLKYGLEKVWKKNFDYSRYFKTRERIVENWSKKNEIVQKNWKLTGRKANFQFKFIRSEFIWSQVWTGKSLEEEF